MVSPTAIEGHANVPAATGVGSTIADLCVYARCGEVAVRETRVGTVFPSRCPERHINWGGSFCIGYDAGRSIQTRDDAIVWWGLLEEHLRLQRVAARTQRWPARKAVAHGDAGPHQIRALEAARELGLEEDYYQMLEGERKWFAGSAAELRALQERLAREDAACPLGCKRNGNVISRQYCQRTLWIDRLLNEERSRIEEEAAFWKSFRLWGASCCGSMSDCPLAVKDGALQDPN